MVKEEIITMIKGLCSATVAPSITLYTLGSWDANQGFCGTSDQYNGWYHAYLFVMIWVVSDFYEWGYHQLGHRYAFFWQHHRHHHKFYNPSPFAVIADEYVVCIASALDVAWALPRGLVRTRAGLPAAAATVSQTSFSSRRSPHALTDLLTLIPRLSRWPRRVCVLRYTDQAARSLPLLAFPLVIPVNVELLFIIYGVRQRRHCFGHFSRMSQLQYTPNALCDMPFSVSC